MSLASRSRAWSAARRWGLGGLVAGLAVWIAPMPSAQQARSAPKLDGYIGGVVKSSQGPEAGVWVIAETNDLPTKLIKSVVTDDNGRFVLPELPAANYSVWVRGYGLADSTPVKTKPGEANLALTAVLAKTPQQAAKVYPANYWYSLMDIPKADEFPGTGPEGNGINPALKTQGQWVDIMKQGCQLCHQLGNELTRGVTHMSKLGFKSSAEAWDYRVQTGQRGNEMNAVFNRYGRPRAIKMFSDWTD